MFRRLHLKKVKAILSFCLLKMKSASSLKRAQRSSYWHFISLGANLHSSLKNDVLLNPTMHLYSKEFNLSMSEFYGAKESGLLSNLSTPTDLISTFIEGRKSLGGDRFRYRNVRKRRQEDTLKAAVQSETGTITNVHLKCCSSNF